MVVMAVAAAVSGAASALQQYLGWNYYVNIVIVGAIILCLTILEPVSCVRQVLIWESQSCFVF